MPHPSAIWTDERQGASDIHAKKPDQNCNNTCASLFNCVKLQWGSMYRRAVARVSLRDMKFGSISPTSRRTYWDAPQCYTKRWKARFYGTSVRELFSNIPKRWRWSQIRSTRNCQRRRCSVCSSFLSEISISDLPVRSVVLRDKEEIYHYIALLREESPHFSL